MTCSEVTEAKRALEAKGQEVTVQAIQQQLGRGEKRQISRFLNQIARRETARTQLAPLPTRPQYAGRPMTLRKPAVDRETEAAEVDAFITARRAQGFGTSAPLQERPPPEDEEEPSSKETRSRQWTMRLRDSLLAEVVPWLVRQGGQ